jgi:hypothetical protein
MKPAMGQLMEPSIRSHLWSTVLIVRVLSSETLAPTYKTTRCHKLSCRRDSFQETQQIFLKGTAKKSAFVNLRLICFKLFLLINLDY